MLYLLHCSFVVLDKVNDKVPRVELWYHMKKPGVAEKYARVWVCDSIEMCSRSDRWVQGGSGITSWIHSFAVWVSMDYDVFAHITGICNESSEQTEESLERWTEWERSAKQAAKKVDELCVDESAKRGEEESSSRVDLV